MGSLGPAEILVILVVALIVLGPERLPEAARKVGQFVGEMRRIGAGFQAELRDAMYVPPSADATAPSYDSISGAGSPPAPGAPPGPSADTPVAPAPEPPPAARPDDPTELP